MNSNLWTSILGVIPIYLLCFLSWKADNLTAKECLVIAAFLCLLIQIYSAIVGLLRGDE